MSLEFMVEKAQMNYELTRDWLHLKQRGHSLAEYFKEQKYSQIVLYGGGDLGQLLIAELEKGDVEIICVYDNNANNLYLEKKTEVYKGQVIEADCVVITAVYEAKQIRDMLLEKKNMPPVISLKEVVEYFG